MKVNEIAENISHTAKRIHDIERKHKVKPGTEEWFKLWFSLPYLKESTILEGYKLQLERDDDMYVLHITDSETGKRTEVRGKSGYESGNYDPEDPLHQLLDKIGKASNISELINGEVVGINPKHPDGASAKAATDVAFNEAKGGLGLTIFDIDETLMRTTAQVSVVKDGKVVRKLNNQEYNNYELQPGEEYDYGEFANAEKFKQESIPIQPMINKLKAILNNAGNSTVIMLTARRDFDDKETFLSTFKDLGIDMSRIHVHRAGNLPGSPAENKEVWIRKYLDTGKYARVRLYDDALSNIKMFNALSNEYPDIQFFPYLVSHEGAIKTVRENFADGKVKGKSRPGRVKRAGASCKGSVSELRRKAKKYSGERGKMYHWCANMKGGKK